MFPWIEIGGARIPSFFIVQSLNACLLLWWSAHRAGRLGLDRRLALDTGLVLLIAGLIGGRLLHALWEAPSYYAADPIRLLDLAAGGFVYYGGFAAALALGPVFLKFRGERSLGPWFDLFAPVVCLGTLIGRLGCALAGCCYGRVCELPWAVRVIDENGLNLLRHPAPLYAAVWELGTLAILLGLERARREGQVPRLLGIAGILFPTWAILHGTGRFFIEFIRDDFRGPAPGGLSLSQWLSILVITIGFAWIWRLSRNETLVRRTR